MSHLEGARTPELRRGRERLTVHNPRIEKALASHCIDPADVAETRRFGNRLQAEADRWVMRGGLSERGRITKSDAHRMFVLAFGRTGRG